MQQTTNYNMNKSELNDFADIRKVVGNFDTIDKGMVYDVGSSSGESNNYVLDLTNINLNKGTSIRFWADKDSTGKITINGTYNLVKAGGVSVSNIKKNTPYTITFDGNANFFLASGGSGAGNDTVNFTSDKLLEGYSANNSDGDKVDGTMPNRGTYTNNNFGLNSNIILPNGYYTSVQIKQSLKKQGGVTSAVSQDVESSYLYTRIPIGAYFTTVSSSGYPEIKSKISDVTNALKTLPSDKKNEIIGNMGCNRCVIHERYDVGDGYVNSPTFNLGFKPKFVYVYTYYQDSHTYYNGRTVFYFKFINNNNNYIQYAGTFSESKQGLSTSEYITINDNGFTLNDSHVKYGLYYTAIG